MAQSSAAQRMHEAECAARRGANTRNGGDRITKEGAFHDMQYRFHCLAHFGGSNPVRVLSFS